MGRYLSWGIYSGLPGHPFDEPLLWDIAVTFGDDGQIHNLQGRRVAIVFIDGMKTQRSFPAGEREETYSLDGMERNEGSLDRLQRLPINSVRFQHRSELLQVDQSHSKGTYERASLKTYLPQWSLIWLAVCSLVSWGMMYWGWLQIRRERWVFWGLCSLVVGGILWWVTLHDWLSLMFSSGRAAFVCLLVLPFRIEREQ